MGAWEELLATEGDIRKKRQAAIYAQKEKQRKVIEITAIVLCVALVGSFVVWVTGALLKSQGVI